MSFVTSSVFSQIQELVINNDYPVVSATVNSYDQKVYFATQTSVRFIDELGQDHVLLELFGQNPNGKFYQFPDELVYVCWNVIDIDLIIPKVTIVKITSDTVTTQSIDYFVGLPYLQDVVYRSDDHIVGLTMEGNQTFLHRTNIDHEVISIDTIDVRYPDWLVSISDNTHVVATEERMYLVKDGAITKQVSQVVNHIQYLINDSLLQVLTDTAVVTYDDNLNVRMIRPTNKDGYDMLQSFDYGDSTYVLHEKGDSSTVSTIAADSTIVEEHTEISNIKYEGIYRDSQYYLRWGTSCNFRQNNVLKVNRTGWPQSHSRANLSIEEYSFVIDSMAGSPNPFGKYHCTYNLQLRNTGDVNIDSMTILSVQAFNYSIFIPTNETLAPGDSRGFTGQAIFESNSQSVYSRIHVYIKEIDSDCDDNTILTSVPITVHVNEEESVPDLIIYPNPSSEHIWISMSGTYNYKIHSASGTEILHETATSGQPIDIRPLISGTYFLTITTDKATTTSRFIKY